MLAAPLFLVFLMILDSDPPGDRDLHCETRDFQSVECLWTVGNTHLDIKSPTVYQLLGRYNETILPDVTIGWSMEAKKRKEKDLILISN